MEHLFFKKITIKNNEVNDFTNFIKTYYQNNNSETILKYFNNWYTNYKIDLKLIYSDYNIVSISDIDNKYVDNFMKWCRKKYFIFSYNKYKKDLTQEIESLIK